MQSQEGIERSFEIISDKVFYERLRSVEQNEWIKVYLFPLINNLTKKLNLVIIDLVKSKPSSDTKEFKPQQFCEVCQSILDGKNPPQVLIYLLSKSSIEEILSVDNKKVRIVCFDQLRQMNQLIKQCVIVTFKLPPEFYKQNDCIYNLEGYKFNPYGKVRQGWNYLNNGRILKAILAKQNQKVKIQLKENVTYSKKQTVKILELIQSVNGLKNQQDKSSKVLQQLSILGENFCHSDKYVTTSNALIPILNFEIQLLCSKTRGQSCKNKLVIEPSKNVTQIFQHLCLNFNQGIHHCEQLIKKKIQSIFVKGKDEEILKKSSDCLTLTNIPTKIANPHLFLKTEFKDKFQQFYVKGFYEYYHYGDHNFNDQGWGCAYRSLETLLSWFRLQQKLNLLTVPTVPQIQNLIDLIDCTSQQKLSNTNTWIGATEVSWVVKKLTGFDCRIMHIKDGKDIVEHAEMFRDHLQNVGTPIMYGGGEYAYSIVGINYSWKLGEIMFLILDPHYNGSDKVQKIIEKKGICWRKPEQMFKKGVFYNFCMPIL